MAVEASLNGFFRDVDFKEKIVNDYGCFSGGLRGCLSYFCLPPCSPRCIRTFLNARHQTRHKVHIADARRLQEEEMAQGRSTGDFFQRHGFVLLQHHTSLSASDWICEKPEGFRKASGPRLIYAKEVEPLIREILPRSTELVFSDHFLRRGPGGIPFYGNGVHQDYGLEKEEMRTTFAAHESFEKWLERLATESYSIINFWRPVLPMEGPVRGTPLAVCDAGSVDLKSVVTQELFGFVPGGQISLGLKFDAKQKWYYYPDMTKDEVLVLRQFHSEPGSAGINTAFHSAFQLDPTAEVRCSSEYRVGVFADTA